jgi:hypothetical protein
MAQVSSGRGIPDAGNGYRCTDIIGQVVGGDDSSSDITQSIRAAVSGRVSAVAELATLPWRVLVHAASRAGKLILTRQAVARALEELRDGKASDIELNRWAWFMRRGYIPGATAPLLSRVDIDYEENAEHSIAEALTRFSELGDEIDGTLNAEELNQPVRLLVAERREF